MLKSIFVSSSFAVISNRPHHSVTIHSLSNCPALERRSKKRSRRMSFVKRLKTGKERWRGKMYCINKIPPNLNALCYLSPNESKSFLTARRCYDNTSLGLVSNKDSVIFVWSVSEINHSSITEEREEGDFGGWGGRGFTRLFSIRAMRIYLKTLKESRVCQQMAELRPTTDKFTSILTSIAEG